MKYSLHLPWNLLRVLPASFLLLTPLIDLEAASDQEMAELRAMVLELKAEVDSLRAQMAAQEAPQTVTAPLAPTPSSLPVAAPPPLVPTASSKYGINFYGYFKADAIHDSGLTSHQEIPFWTRPDTGTNQGNFTMTAKETRLGMDFAGPEVAGGTMTGKLEMDFFGNINTPTSLSSNHAYALRTRHVYMNWDFGDWSLLAGKTWEPYIIAFPQTLNFSYYNFMGQLGLRKTQLRLTKKIGDGLELVGAILEPMGGINGADADGDLEDDGKDTETPVISAKILYKTPLFGGRNAIFGLSGVYGREEIDLPLVSAKTYEAWAVTAAMTIPITDFITWRASAYCGSNLDSYWGNIGQGINLDQHTEIDGRGGWTQLQFKASDAVTMNFGYSIDDPENDDLSDGARAKNESALVNLYYSFNPSVVLGFELMRLETEYKNGDTATDNHVQSSLIYKF